MTDLIGYILPLHWGIASSSLLVIGIVGVAILWKMRRKREPLSLIRRNLSELSSHIEEDLTHLQLQDRYGVLSEGWNGLLKELADARKEIEEYEIQRQAEETISSYQTNWAAELLQKMPYGLMNISQDQRIIFANAAAARMLKTELSDLHGCKTDEVFGQSIDGDSLSSTGTRHKMVSLDEDRVTLRLTMVRREEDDEATETIIFMQDVSQQKEVVRAREEFFYHVAHELRTPLTNIRAYAETLSEGVLNDPEALRECYNVIVGETQRLARLVEDILNVSQLEVGSARLDVSEVQIARLIRKAVEDMQASADEEQLDLVLSLPPKVPKIRGDKDRLAGVLTNLIGNAIKYTPAGGRVEVSCAEEGTRLRIKVTDTGIGFSPKDQRKVFEKFYRASDEQVDRKPGTGLGLAIAQETVHAHGGTIELESKPGSGSSFSILLPVHKVAESKF